MSVVQGLEADMETVLTIRIDAGTQRAIERLARKKRMSKSAVVREALQRFASEPPPTRHASAYASVADLIGSYHSGDGGLSVRTGSGLREALRRGAPGDPRGRRPLGRAHRC